MADRRPTLAALALILAAAVAHAADAPASTASDATLRYAAPSAHLTAADPALEAHMLAITGELRCLVCQNQTIADSHADLAVDLRQEVREMLQRGMTDAQVRRYMTDRYGDFILYRPPLKPATAVLWIGPAVLLAVAALALIVTLRRRTRLADELFEPDPDLDDDTAAARPVPPGTAA
jgi:cytochrome c-type biogenesis protein CcmH